MRLALSTILYCLILCGVPTNFAAGQTFAERIVGGFTVPTIASHAPGDPTRLFVGRIWSADIQIVDLVSRSILPQPFLTITDLPNPQFAEQGLLGLAFDPDYAANGFFYVNYTGPNNSLNIRRFRVLGDPASSSVADPDSGHLVLHIPKDPNWHNGGWTGFSPHDGYLNMSTGDPGGGNAHDIINNLHGKVLRIDVRGDDFPDDPMRNYAIPPTNPFVGTEGDDEIWAFGLRNPWQASFDRETGDLWINDVGERAREEVNFQPVESAGGENYGWWRREGTIANPDNPGPLLPEYTDPIYDYAHNEPNPLFAGVTIGASGLYRGPVAALRGHYLFTDFESKNIWKLDPDAIDPRASVTHVNNRLLPSASFVDRIAAFGKDAVGNLYLLDYNGGPTGDVFRIATVSKDAIWNGDDAAAGVAGDGMSWGDANNWTRGASTDATFSAQDHAVFSAGSSQQVIQLDADHTTSAMTFAAPYVLEGHTLKVLSGNVTVAAG